MVAPDADRRERLRGLAENRQATGRLEKIRWRVHDAWQKTTGEGE
jgi:hypothetical protein